MGKTVTTLSGACSKEGRQKIRKNLGTLKSLTVQETTKARYNKGLQNFFDFLKQEELELPRKRDDMDPLVSDYLEYLWAQGEGRATASNFMAALQDYMPKLKNNLPGSWRLMRTWTTHEVPSRAPPMTETVLHAMVGWAITHEHYTFGLSLLVAFYGLYFVQGNFCLYKLGKFIWLRQQSQPSSIWD